MMINDDFSDLMMISEHCFQVLRETELGSVAKPVSIPRCVLTCVPCPVDLGSNCTEKHGQEQHLCRKNHRDLDRTSAFLCFCLRLLADVNLCSQLVLKNSVQKKHVNQIGKSQALKFCCPKVYHPKLLSCVLKLPKIWNAEAVAMFAPCHQRGPFLRFGASLQVLEIAGLLTMSAATLCPATCSATVDGSSWPCRYHGNGCKVNITNTDASRFSA